LQFDVEILSALPVLNVGRIQADSQVSIESNILKYDGTDGVTRYFDGVNLLDASTTVPIPESLGGGSVADPRRLGMQFLPAFEEVSIATEGSSFALDFDPEMGDLRFRAGSYVSAAAADHVVAYFPKRSDIEVDVDSLLLSDEIRRTTMFVPAGSSVSLNTETLNRSEIHEAIDDSGQLVIHVVLPGFDLCLIVSTPDETDSLTVFDNTPNRQKYDTERTGDGRTDIHLDRNNDVVSLGRTGLSLSATFSSGHHDSVQHSWTLRTDGRVQSSNNFWIDTQSGDTHVMLEPSFNDIIDGGFEKVRVSGNVNGIDQVTIENRSELTPIAYARLVRFGDPDKGLTIDIGFDNHIDRNPLGTLDVNADGAVSSIDVLTVVNYLARRHRGQSETRFDSRFLDTNGDGTVSALDALMVVQELAFRARQGENAGRTMTMPVRGAPIVGQQRSERNDHLFAFDDEWYVPFRAF
ncbi:MAG: dockerin type I domain-containing protein, partial [Planctomycetota bacterium]